MRGEKAMSLTVYIAGAYHDRDRVAQWMERVHKTPGMVLAHDWVTIIDEVKKVHGEEHDIAITDQERREYARGDLEQVRKSDVFWFLVPDVGGRGCWFESGAAWVWNIPLVSSGPNSRVSIFTQLSEVVFADDEDAFAWISRLAAERRSE